MYVCVYLLFHYLVFVYICSIGLEKSNDGILDGLKVWYLKHWCEYFSAYFMFFDICCLNCCFDNMF